MSHRPSPKKQTLVSISVVLKVFLSDPGKARGCSTNSFVIYLVIHSLITNPFPPTALRRSHTQKVTYRSSSYKRNYVKVIKNFLNIKGHQNPISGSNVTANTLKGWILPIGGASAGEGLLSTGLPCLV